MSTNINISKSGQLINIFLGVLFFSFAIIQLNDPDPMIWFSLYMIVAIVSIASNYKNINKLIIWALIIGYLIYAGMHFSLFLDWMQTENKNEVFGEMVYKKPYLEGTREFLGLVMAASALLFQIRKK
jgi:hypothetical protein